MTPNEFLQKYAPGQVASPATQNTPVVPMGMADATNNATNNVTNDTGFPLSSIATPMLSGNISPTAKQSVSSPTPSSLGPINVSNANMMQKDDTGKYKGLCQRFVEDATYGKHGIFDSAISAWNQLPNKVQGLNGVKPGDLVYFSANAGNNNDGHVGIYEGNGVFKSATSNGIEDYNINDWTKRTGQSVLGYVPT